MVSTAVPFDSGAGLRPAQRGLPHTIPGANAAQKSGYTLHLTLSQALSAHNGNQQSRYGTIQCSHRRFRTVRRTLQCAVRQALSPWALEGIVCQHLERRPLPRLAHPRAPAWLVARPL